MLTFLHRPSICETYVVTHFELLTSNTDGVQGASETPPMVQEGVRVDNLIKIQKRGYTKFAYIVFLNIQLLTESEGKNIKPCPMKYLAVLLLTVTCGN